MRIIHKQIIIAIVGVCVLLATLSISQISDDAIVLAERATVAVCSEQPLASVASIFLKLDDKIEIFADQNDTAIPTSISVSFLGRPSVSSAVSANPQLDWVCNGDQEYTIYVRCADLSDSQVVNFTVDYTVIRGQYTLIWLFPAGLIIGCVLLLCALEFRRVFLNVKSQSLSPKALSADVFRESVLKNNFVKKLKTIDFYALLLFLVLVTASLFLNSSMLHNDEIGGGKNDNWGYYAWGYVDTNNQIADLIKDFDFSYDSWHSLQTMNKPPFANYCMALFVIIFPHLDPLIASRLFVQLAAAVTPVIVYFLVKNIFNRKSGIIAAFLLFFNPIYLQYTRASYLDGFMLLVLSLFLLMLYKTSVTSARHMYSYLTGLSLGLVISTKSFLFLYLLIPLVFIWLLFMSPKGTVTVKTAIVASFKICFVAVVVFFLLWPAVWVNPLLKLVFQGAFFGLFGTYGPLFSVTYSTLFLGNIVSPSPMIHALTLLFYQTTYIELLGFILGIVYLLHKIKSKTTLAILVFLGLNLLGLAFFYSYQHHLLYVIMPFAIIAGIGYGYVVNSFKHKLKPKLLKVPDKLLNLGLLLIVGCQIFLIIHTSPYYGLYYNNAFLGGKRPIDVFEVPEPVYGLDQVAEYIRANPPSSNTILTTNSPHILQTYLPDYVIKSTYGFSFDDNYAKNLVILRSLGIEYVVIGVSTLQINPNLDLKIMLDEIAKLYVCEDDGLPLAYLYRIPPISWNSTLWENSIQTSNAWHINSNAESCSFNILSEGQLEINLNLNSSYPPSLWFKLYQLFSTSLDLSDASLYLVSSCSANSNVTISITLMDQDSNYVETVLRRCNIIDTEVTVAFTKIVDLNLKKDKCIDFSKITRVDLTFYNAGKISETVTIQNFAFVN